MLIGPKTKRVLALAVCLVLLIGLLPLGAAAADGDIPLYSYNGKVYPDINSVWNDKSSYPDACIYNDTLYLGSITVGSNRFFFDYQVKFYVVDGVWVKENKAGSLTINADPSYQSSFWFSRSLSMNGSVVFPYIEPVRISPENPTVPTLTTSFDGQVISLDAGSLRFFITATNVNGTLSCQWYVNGSPISGEWSFIEAEPGVWLQGWVYTPIENGTREIYCIVTNTIGEKLESVSTGTVIVNYGVDGSGSGGSGDNTELIDRFDTIDMQLEGIESTVSNIAENVDQLPEEIVGGMEQIQEQEKEQASAEGSDLVDDILSVIPNESQAFMDALGGLTDTMSYSGTACKLVIPAVDFPALGDKVPAWRMMEETELDFEQYITMMPEGILLLVRSLLTIALIVYCFKELYDTISYVLTLRKSGGEG